MIIFFLFSSKLFVIVVQLLKRMINKSILVIMIVFNLVGCKNPVTGFLEEAKKEVGNSIESLSKDSVKKSINYIGKNYKKKISKKYVYHTVLLNRVCSNKYIKKQNICNMASAAYEYMLRQSKGNKKELEDSFNIVNKKLDKELDEFYEIYQRYVVVNGYLSKAKTKLLVERDETDFITTKKLEKAITYISNNYDNVFRNNEVTDNICYYSLYLENVGQKVKKNNKIVELGKKTKKYLQELNEKDKEVIKKILEDIDSNKDNLMAQLLNN